MSIRKINQNNISTQDILLTPEKTYVSSSAGVTGAVYVFQRRSHSEKETRIQTSRSSSFLATDNTETIRDRIRFAAQTNTNVSDLVKSYINSIHNLPEASAKNQQVRVLRFTPDYSLTSNTMRKQTIENILFPYWAKKLEFLNYHSLNFLSASTLPSARALLYPQQTGTDIMTGFVTGSWLPTGSFTFDFWLKPHGLLNTTGYRAGTILHMSSAYAISIISGSDQNPDATPAGFRILLQLSSSANLRPESVDINNLPSFTFISEDNVLKPNIWHNVTIRWGAAEYNSGSGSIRVNTNENNFHISSQSIIPTTFSPEDSPSVLVVGNYYKGPNAGTSDVMSKFFATDVATNDGVQELYNTMLPVTEPTGFEMSNPLHAELQNVRIYNRYVLDSDLEQEIDSTRGLIFNLPPVFQEHSQQRNVLISPFETQLKETTKPFSVDFGFNFNVLYSNLENFVQETVTKENPRLYLLSGSAITTTTNLRTINDLLYTSSSVVARNLLLVPSDNGLGKIYATGSSQYISLKDMVLTSSLTVYRTANQSGSIQSGFLNSLNLNSPETLTNTSNRYYVAEETKSGNSNLVTIFDISSLFYGNKIKPGSLTISNTNFSGSNGMYQITLKDDSEGNLYKQVPTGSSATWNVVGHVFYDEGLIYLKHPFLYSFGETDFTINFKGEQTIHSFTIDCEANGDINKTHNPTHQEGMEIDDDFDSRNKDYVAISELLIHDENLNIIGRTKLAQPTAKRTGEKLLVRFKYDI